MLRWADQKRTGLRPWLPPFPSAGGSCAAWLVPVLAVLLSASPVRSAAAERDAAPFRVAFSSGMFADVNENDACVVTRSGFETMSELNPQVGKQLKIVDASPRLVGAVFCLRADYSPVFKEQLLAGLKELHASPAGQQVLTIFHSEKMEERPPSLLQGALDLLAEHRKLCEPFGAVKTPHWPGEGRKP